jgi:hypothetical protein
MDFPPPIPRPGGRDVSETLPPFLREAQIFEIEALPLQVSLLTMEIAAIRRTLTLMASSYAAIAQAASPPGMIGHEPRDGDALTA